MYYEPIRNGAERTLSMKIVVTRRVRNGETRFTREAKLESGSLCFEAVAEFARDVETINRMLRTAAKRDDSVVMEIAKYDYVPGEGIKDGRIENYGRWEYAGSPANDLYGLSKEEEGIYFKPDERYVPENHDIWYDFTLKSVTA